MSELLFHSGINPSKNKTSRNAHTLLFQKSNDILFCTWSKATQRKGNRKVDTFSKKEGRRIAIMRMEKLQSSDIETMIRLYSTDDIRFYLPYSINSSFSYFLDKARKFFKMEDKALFVFKGLMHKIVPSSKWTNFQVDLPRIEDPKIKTPKEEPTE